MATALSNLLALLALDNKSYLDGLSASQKAADSFGTNLSSVGGAVVMGALTAAASAVIGIGTAAFDAAETLDEAYDSISVATGATGETLGILQEDFRAVFSSVPTDSATAADAIGILNSRLDITGDALQDIAIPLLEVTRLLKGDIKTNAEAFTRVIGDWNIPTDKAAGSLDALFVASQQTGAPLDTLMQQLVMYGAPMRNFGFSFDQAGALLANFAAQGVNTEIVMSGMRIAQGKFISSGVDMATGLWDTVDAIKNATSKTDGLAIATEIFGAKAAGDMYDTIIAGKFDIDGLTASMNNADGAILDAAASTSDWGEKWKVFQNKMTVALGPLGETIRAGLGSALDSLVEIFNRPDVQASITQFANFAVAAIGAIVNYIPTFITGVTNLIAFLQNNQGIVVGIFAALGVAALAWGVTTAVAAWTAIAPMLPVIAVILLIAAAAYFVYQAWTNNWGGIQEKTAAVIAWITGAVNGLVAFFTPIIKGALDVVLFYWNYWSAQVQAVIALFSLAAQGKWYEFGAKLREIFNNIINAIGTILVAGWTIVKNGFSTIVTNTISFFKTTDWASVGRSILEGIARGITGGTSLITTAAKNAAAAALAAAKGFLGIHSPSTVFEMQVGYQMAAGVAAGWEGGLASLLTPAFQNLSPANATLAPASYQAPVSTATGQQPGGDAMLLEDIRRLLRDLPNEIARATTSAAAKMPKGRG